MDQCVLAHTNTSLKGHKKIWEHIRTLSLCAFVPFEWSNQTGSKLTTRLQLALLNAILNICFNYTTKQYYTLINFGQGKQLLLTSHEFGSECGISGYKLQTGHIAHHSFNAPNTFKLQKCIGKLGQTTLAEFFQNFEQRCQPP